MILGLVERPMSNHYGGEIPIFSLNCNQESLNYTLLLKENKAIKSFFEKNRGVPDPACLLFFCSFYLLP